MNCLFKSLVCLVVITLTACSSTKEPEKREPVVIEVFKTPTCGCCGKWVTHLEESGFILTVQDLDDLDSIKNKFGIAANLQSCHTGVSSNGYFFEGHIPAKIMAEFLANPPKNALGLTVPGMPAGSPGMEMGDRFNPYRVLLVKKDGSTEVFKEVKTMAAQH